MSKIPVAILGATGMVGQRFVERLAQHPRFEVVELAASDRSVGKPYGQAAAWRLEGEPLLQDIVVQPCDPAVLRAPLVFSALDKGVALAVEAAFRDAGRIVVSNASAYRMDPTVPLIIPEVNPQHLSMVEASVRAGRGAIVCNPNCTSMPFVMALAPLHRRWGVQAAVVSSWQAVSGAGYPGEPSWDILGNVHPHAGDEEDKLAEEPRKILGDLGGTGIRLADFVVSARCVRVPVVDGHLVSAQIRLRGDPSPEEVRDALSAFQAPVPLPSSPVPLLRITDRRDRPQPRLDAAAGGGMAVTIGRIEPCPVMGVKFFALAHNAVRGAAGGAVAVAELIDATGLLARR
jgi:aspartate-semialdehyde dehydrogenase